MQGEQAEFLPAYKTSLYNFFFLMIVAKLTDFLPRYADGFIETVPDLFVWVDGSYTLLNSAMVRLTN